MKHSYLANLLVLFKESILGKEKVGVSHNMAYIYFGNRFFVTQQAIFDRQDTQSYLYLIP